jgi:hypothetical protein
MDAANSDSRSPQRQICSSDECTEKMSRRRGSVSLSQSAQHKSLDDQEYDHNRYGRLFNKHCNFFFFPRSILNIDSLYDLI